jgi:Bacterial Ig-like domain (group 1).
MRLIGCFIIALAMVILLAACSGNGFSGGNSAGSGGTASGVETALSLTNATTGASTTEISANAPGRATATLKDVQTGSPIASAVVTFSTTLATINPSAGTAVTDSNGQASVELLAGDTKGSI